MYHIYVRDSALNRLGEIDDFKLLTLVPKFNDVGAWSIDLPYDVSVDKELVKGNGIIVVRNGVTLLSGPVTSSHRKWDSTGDVVTVSGSDDNVWLSRRIAYPVVGTDNFTVSPYDVLSGPCETVLRHYVDVNAGPSALAERQITGLTLAVDQQQGQSIIGRARFDNLLTLLQSLALSGGDLGFRVVQVGNSLQFQVYTPTDKTGTAKFSTLLGNLQSFDYSESVPDANYIIAGGSGDLTNRTFFEQSDSDSVTEFGRFEEFLDTRDTTDFTEIEQSITSELSSKAKKTSLSITPIDTDGLAFGRDYNLGDKVSVAVTSSKKVTAVIQDVVRTVSISLTSDQSEVIQPTVGTPDSLATNVPKIYKQMNDLRTRISNLERRQ